MLILITNSFPYIGQEYFLESEINFLDESQIIIMPLHKNKLRDPKYEKLNTSDILTDRKIKNIASAILSMLFSRIFWKELKHIKLNSAYFFITVSIKIFFLHQKLNKYCNVNKISTIYTYWFEATTYASIILKKQGKINNVFTRAHGGDMFRERIPSEHFFYRKQLSDNIDKIFSASILGKKDIEMQEVSPEKIEVCHLGVESQLNTDSFIKEFRIVKDSITFVSCSNVIPLKRIDLIIDFLTKLSVVYNIEWVHIGDGPILNIIKRKTLKFKHLFLGRLDNASVKTFYKENYINYFIHFSDHEGGLPVAIQEAMSFGIIPIARDRGAVSELVSDRIGLILPPDYNYTTYFELFKNLLKRDNFEFRRNVINHQQKYFSHNNYVEFSKKIKY